MRREKERLLFQNMLRILIVCISIGLVSGCVKQIKKEKEIPVAFTVLGKEEIPEEMQKMIEERKQEPMQITYGDGNWLYMAKGYGKQETTGYSIAVLSVEETEHSVFVKTELRGPGGTEEVLEKETCPYVVVKTEYREKEIVFE